MEVTVILTSDGICCALLESAARESDYNEERHLWQDFVITSKKYDIAKRRKFAFL